MSKDNYMNTILFYVNFIMVFFLSIIIFIIYLLIYLFTYLFISFIYLFHFPLDKKCFLFDLTKNFLFTTIL